MKGPDMILAREKMIENWRKGVRTLYPPVCPVCRKILAADETGWIHPACRGEFKRVLEPVCKKCGKPLPDPTGEYCYDCRRKRRSFECGHSLWIYDEKTAQSLFAYKYGGKREFASYYSYMLLKVYGDWIRSLDLDALVPVPVSRQKLRKRGYNQAGLIADQLGDALDLNVSRRELVRRHSTTPQKELTRQQRQKNLETAFYAEKGSFSDMQRVLLVDDIFTTGSTAEYCSRAMLGAGARRVWVLTLCIGALF